MDPAALEAVKAHPYFKDEVRFHEHVQALYQARRAEVLRQYVWRRSRRRQQQQQQQQGGRAPDGDDDESHDPSVLEVAYAAARRKFDAFVAARADPDGEAADASSIDPA